MNRILIPFLALATVLPLAAAAPPMVGEKAPDFALSTPEGKSVRLSEMTSKGPVVLVVLRGYPGYQCPYCNRQVQDFIQKSQGFSEECWSPCGAGVSWSPAGPGSESERVLGGQELPYNFDLVLDPGYTFTNMYGVRWDAVQETAYPSTFLIDRQGVVFFSKIVKEHGGRTTVAEILDIMPKPKPAK